jgi:hypothetical protein
MEEVEKEERLRPIGVGCGWIGFLEWRYSVPLQVLHPNGGSQSQWRFSIQIELHNSIFQFPAFCRPKLKNIRLDLETWGLSTRQ